MRKLLWRGVVLLLLVRVCGILVLLAQRVKQDGHEINCCVC